MRAPHPRPLFHVSGLALGIVLGLATPCGSAVAARSVAWDAVERVPGRQAVIVSVSGKKRVYFEIAPSLPLEVSIEGPARLRVVSRAIFGEGAPAPVTYSVRVGAGPSIWGESRTESSPAPAAKRLDGRGRLGKSRALLLDVPAGRHRMVVAVDGTPSVLVRLLVASPKRGKGEQMVSITPLAAARSVTVVERERMIPYYTTVASSPVRFHLIGPTRFEISSRLDFEASMRGPQRYRLAIRIDGSLMREEAFTTTKATAASYAEVKDRVPSKLDRITINVPDGAHDLEVVLKSPKRGTAQIHGRIPQPTVGSEG